MSITDVLTDNYVAAVIAASGFLIMPIGIVVRRFTRNPERGYGLENQIQVIGCCLLISGIILSSGAMSWALAVLITAILVVTALVNGLAAYSAVRQTFMLPTASLGAADRVLTICAIASCTLPFGAATILTFA
jgi:hypothetical protein